MVEKKLCGVCNQNEAARTCDECGIDLCDVCTDEVILQEQNPGYMVKPGAPSISPLRPSSTKKKVCPKCMKEADFY